MMQEPTLAPVRRILGLDLNHMLDREWLVTNGLGGFASGTISGAATRRYHGLLVAAHPAPLGRLMMFNHLIEQFRFPDWSVVTVGGLEHRDKLDILGADLLKEFRLESGLPVWRYESHNHVIEKRLFMPNRHNTVHVIYTLIEGPGPVRLKLRPSVHFRSYDAPVSAIMRRAYTLTATEDRYELAGEDNNMPVLRFFLHGDQGALTLAGAQVPDVLYRVEEDRGYEGVGALFNPGLFRVNLLANRPVTLTASTESWDQIMALAPADALKGEMVRRTRLIEAGDPAVRTEFGAELILAADQFVITPAGRPLDTARAHATGDEARTVIAGYHWFTDWGRDTMISLEGLTLVTGRSKEAGSILRTFAGHVRDGLIPNYFPDGENQGVYHTADATLWFFHALGRYLDATQDRAMLRDLIPMLKEIVAKHQAGTRFGIGVDPADGLLRQGAQGYQLTWMDAKVGDWVVTPRRGKAVEINALWFNALKLLATWLREENAGGAEAIEAAAQKAQDSFNRRFWNPTSNCLFDVVDGETGDDPACRPNQVFAISLPHPILDRSHWASVMKIAQEKLLTPVGLRSLSPDHPDFKVKYYGDLRARDAAYHQGTIWAWLIGPFIDAWWKTFPDKLAEGRHLLDGFEAHLSEACIGTISEVFDAEKPFCPRACIAQAWSVAEVLRCLKKFQVKDA